MANKVLLTGGNFQDAFGNPVANGTLVFKLSADAQVSTSLVTAGKVTTAALGSDGNVTGTVYIWPNDVLTPTDTVYFARLYNVNGQLVWRETLTITSGCTYNFGTTVCAILQEISDFVVLEDYGLIVLE